VKGNTRRDNVIRSPKCSNRIDSSLSIISTECW
jgi:hypothetical protein